MSDVEGKEVIDRFVMLVEPELRSANSPPAFDLRLLAAHAEASSKFRIQQPSLIVV